MPTSITPSQPTSPTNKPSKKPCPLCSRTLAKKYTWRGVLYATVCFPCGIYFCLRRRTLRCKACKFEVVFHRTEELKSAESFQCYDDMGWQLFQSKSANAAQGNYSASPMEMGNEGSNTTGNTSTATKTTEVGAESSLAEKGPAAVPAVANGTAV